MARVVRFVNFWAPILVFTFFFCGAISLFSTGPVRGQDPTAISDALHIEGLQQQVKGLQDLPAEFAAMRERMARNEAKLDELSKKADDTHDYEKWIFMGVLTVIGERIWKLVTENNKRAGGSN